MIITPLLKLAVEKQASDLFISVGAPISIKINGATLPVNDQQIDAEMVRRIAYELITPDQIAAFEQKLELNFSIRVPDVGNFRVNMFRQRRDTAIVIRYIRASVRSIDELRLPPILKNLIMEKRGLVLVVGATGSGKSTTLASMIEHRNNIAAGHILTIEDPIEYLFKHNKSIVSQREVGTDTLSYDNALSNALREAPDVLMIGEINDRETLKHALIFAQTGHLCLSTLHASNSYHALNRMVGLFPHDARQNVLSDISTSLRAIISQRLVKGVDGKLIPVVEILLNTNLIAGLIKSGEIEEIREAMEQTISSGSQTFEQVLYNLFKGGRITREEALRNADSSSNLAALIDYTQKGKGKTKAHEPAPFVPAAAHEPNPASFEAIELNLNFNHDNR